MAKQLEKYQEVERSMITTYRKTIWSPFVLAVKKYGLIAENDKIAVCISGGKDSMLLAKLMQQLQRHSEVPFEMIFKAGTVSEKECALVRIIINRIRGTA